MREVVGSSPTVSTIQTTAKAAVCFSFLCFLKKKRAARRRQEKNGEEMSNTEIGSAYDKICEQWDTFCKGRQINKCIVEFERLLKRESRILDVGCGTGYPIAEYLVRQGHTVTGVDVSAAMIQKAKGARLKNTEFIHADFMEYRAEEKFDAIVAFDSLWHVCHDLQREIYARAAALLEAGGLFLFTHGTVDGEVYGEMFGQRFYHSALSFEELESILRANSFETVAVYKNYAEPTTGSRDLLMIVKMVRASATL